MGHAEVPWRHTDVTGMDVGTRDCALESALTADRAQRFDPTLPPLVQYHLTKIGPERHRFVLTVHHAVSDGWSLWSDRGRRQNRTWRPRRNPPASPPFDRRPAEPRATAAPTLSTLVRAAWPATLLGVAGGDDGFAATVAARSPEVPAMTEIVGLHTNLVPVRARRRPSYNPARPGSRAA
ncbi:hypothetical protein GCM10010178_49730 [Lentzea flava]|uniref:Condensation domain-containing protein n=2 Tax=Lentzea flava TaxID=103732 RepID=A0ABQ2USP4_9PSEU|nr:hypothetical protein GCM10010178_49730 [Lentzea flava]